MVHKGEQNKSHSVSVMWIKIWFLLRTLYVFIKSPYQLERTCQKLPQMCYSTWTYLYQVWVHKHNMSGEIKGTQARVRAVQPLALYVHCGPLVTQAACTSSSVTCDALKWLHKLGCLYNQSGKYKTTFKEIVWVIHKPKAPVSNKVDC